VLCTKFTRTGVPTSSSDVVGDLDPIVGLRGGEDRGNERAEGGDANENAADGRTNAADPAKKPSAPRVDGVVDSGADGVVDGWVRARQVSRFQHLPTTKAAFR
jgi:hypothetical protein